MLTLVVIIILAVVQGLAELLPVSSSAHVIAAARLMGIRDTSTPQFTLMLVMLHCGTMFAVIFYFWTAWQRVFFSSLDSFVRFITKVFLASAMTLAIGFPIKIAIEKYLEHKHPEQGKAEIEQLFSQLDLLAAALGAVGVLILVSGLVSLSRRRSPRKTITTADSLVIGAIQGICLPFRGFSRSGATISVGLLRGITRQRNEEFSFALAVALTPAVVGREVMRLISHHGQAVHAAPLTVRDFVPSLLGMAFSFLAGLAALGLLSKLLEKGQWWVFGVYCLAAAGGVYWMHVRGY